MMWFPGAARALGAGSGRAKGWRASLFCLLLLGWSANALAAICNSTGGGTWNAAARWSCGHVPLAVDDVFVLNGHTITIDTAALAQNVTVNTGGILRFATTTARSLLVSNAGAQGNITIQTGGTLDVDTASNVTHSLTLVGNLVNNGTLNLARDANSLCNTTFDRNGNQTISGTGATTVFNAVIVDMGTARANTLDVQAAGFTLSATGYVDINNGTFEISANIATIAPFDNAPKATTPDFYVIPPTGGFWLNSDTIVNIATVTSYNVSTDGLFRVSDGTVNLGRASDDRLRIRPTAGNTGLVQMEGGAMNITGRLTSVNVTDNGVFVQSGGTITTGTIGNAIATFGAFFLGSATSFTMTGGTLIVQNISTGAGAGNNDYDVRSPTSTVTGGLVQIGSAVSTAGQTIEVNSVAPVWDFAVNNTRTPTALLNSTLTVRNNLTIGAGSTLNANNQAISIGNGNNSGNWTNNGTFTAGTGTVTFTGTAAASIGGSNATTFNNLVINKAANNVSVACGTPSVTVNGTLTLTSGDLDTAGTSPACSTACANQVPIIVGAAGTIAGGSATSYVQGALRKLFNANSTLNFRATAGQDEFPIGDPTNYTPVELTAGGTSTAGNITACVTPTDHPQVTSPPVATGGIDAAQSVNRYWSLTTSTINTATGTGAVLVDATFKFVAADVDAGATTSLFVVEKWNGAVWSPTTTVTAAATSTRAQNIDLSGATNDFAIGEAITGITALPGTFNAFDTGTPAGAVLGMIQTKQSGVAFAVRAVRLNTAKNAIETTYAQTGVTVELLDASDNTGALAATGCRPIGTGAGQWKIIVGTTQTVNFAAGIVATINFTVANSFRDVRVHIVKTGTGVGEGCSTDRFAIRPASLAASALDANWQTAGTTRTLANTGATGGNVHKASTAAATTPRPFTLRATPAPATATNYDGSPTVVTGFPSCAALCTAVGTLGITAASWTGSGVRENATANYSEVGTFNLQLEDTSYASVDAVDGTTQATRTVPASATSQIGRFVPDRFEFSAPSTPRLQTFGVPDSACTTPPAGSKRSFTYIGQGFWYTALLADLPSATVEAVNAEGTITSNYRASLGLFKLAASGIAQTYSNNGVGPALDASAIPAANLVAGVGTGTYSADNPGLPTSSAKLAYVRSTTSPIPAVNNPFSANISLTVSASDTSESSVTGNGTITTVTALVFNGTGAGMAFDSGSQFRYGRLRLGNAFGTTLLDLSVPLTAEYYDGSVFVANADNCTTLLATDIRFAFVTSAPKLAACDTRSNPSTTITFTNGAANYRLTKPPVAIPVKDGAVDLTVNLGGASAGNTCIAVGGVGPTVTNAAKTWLQGNWTGGSYTADPSGRETFGLYKSADEFIYLREVY